MTQFEKGKPRPVGAGRKKGTPNKTTQQSRETIAQVVEGNVHRLDAWIDEIYTKDGPQAAFKCLASLLEYYVPKMHRVESVRETDHVQVVIIDDIR